MKRFQNAQIQLQMEIAEEANPERKNGFLRVRNGLASGGKTRRETERSRSGQLSDGFVIIPVSVAEGGIAARDPAFLLTLIGRCNKAHGGYSGAPGLPPINPGRRGANGASLKRSAFPLH